MITELNEKNIVTLRKLLLLLLFSAYTSVANTEVEMQPLSCP